MLLNIKYKQLNLNIRKINNIDFYVVYNQYSVQ